MAARRIWRHFCIDFVKVDLMFGKVFYIKQISIIKHFLCDTAHKSQQVLLLPLTVFFDSTF